MCNSDELITITKEERHTLNNLLCAVSGRIEIIQAMSGVTPIQAGYLMQGLEILYKITVIINKDEHRKRYENT